MLCVLYLPTTDYIDVHRGKFVARLKIFNTVRKDI